MACYLLKTEPGEYAYDDLEREARTAWTGVANAQARGFLREIRRRDEAFIYHTGKEKAIVGLARAAANARLDPDADDDRAVTVDLVPVARARVLVTLAAIKADPRFADFALVRQSRLSVMPVPEALAALLKAMAGLP